MAGEYIPVHIKDRFFQRYLLDLTIETLREIKMLAVKSNRIEKNPDVRKPDTEIVTFSYRGSDIRAVWCRRSRTFITFLPKKHDRVAWCLPRRSR